MIPDPQRNLYAQYGAETSWLAFAKSAGRLKDIAAATAKGFLPGKMEGEVNQVPAEFLIDENGIIRTAFYGRDIGDHLDISIIEHFASGR